LGRQGQHALACGQPSGFVGLDQQQLTVILNLFQDSKRGLRVILKQVQDDEIVGFGSEKSLLNHRRRPDIDQINNQIDRRHLLSLPAFSRRKAKAVGCAGLHQAQPF
jgi:hypothetical protein